MVMAKEAKDRKFIVIHFDSTLLQVKHVVNVTNHILKSINADVEKHYLMYLSRRDLFHQKLKSLALKNI